MKNVVFYLAVTLFVGGINGAYGDTDPVTQFVKDEAARAVNSKKTGSIGKEASEVKSTEKKRMVVFRIDKNGDREYLDAAQLETETKDSLVKAKGEKVDENTLASLDTTMGKYGQTIANDAPESAAYVWFRMDYFDFCGWYRGSRYFVTWIPDYYFWGYPYGY